MAKWGGGGGQRGAPGPVRGGFGRAAEEDHMALADPRQGRMVRRQARPEDRDGAPEERRGRGVVAGGPVEPGEVVGHAGCDRTRAGARRAHYPDLTAGRLAATVARVMASGRSRDRALLSLLDAGTVAGPDRTRRAGLALARGAVRAAAGAGPPGAAHVAVGVAAG